MRIALDHDLPRLFIAEVVAHPELHVRNRFAFRAKSRKVGLADESPGEVRIAEGGVGRGLLLDEIEALDDPVVRLDVVPHQDDARAEQDQEHGRLHDEEPAEVAAKTGSI